MNILRSLQSLKSFPDEMLRIIDEDSTLPNDMMCFELKKPNFLYANDCKGNVVVDGDRFLIRVYFDGSELISFAPTTKIIRLFLSNNHIMVFGNDDIRNVILTIHTLCGDVVSRFPVQFFDGKKFSNGAFDGERIIHHIEDFSGTHVFQYSMDGKVVNHYCLPGRFPFKSMDRNLNLITVTKKTNFNENEQADVSLFRASTYNSSGKLVSQQHYGPVKSQDRQFFIVRGNLCAYEETKTGFVLCRLNPVDEKGLISWEESWQESWEELSDPKLSKSQNQLLNFQKHMKQVVQLLKNERSLNKQIQKCPSTRSSTIVTDPDGYIFFKTAHIVSEITVTCFKIWL